MKYLEFDQNRALDLVLLGRVAIDFNPAYNDQVKEDFKPLKDVHMFEKYVGGSPANIAVGVSRHGLGMYRNLRKCWQARTSHMRYIQRSAASLLIL